MRYRRYYSQKNRDGSRTVVSTGPVVGLLVYSMKFVLLVLVFFWPLVVVHANFPGVWGWLIGIVAEIIWLALIFAVRTAIEGKRSVRSRFGGNSRI